jgi:ribokinase
VFFRFASATAKLKSKFEYSTMLNSEVVVVGSINVDFVAYCLDEALPAAGQTVFGTLFEKNYGGKGSNQCVQASRLNCSVELIGKVGPDEFGRDYRAQLNLENVGTSLVDTAPNVSTGIAQITVSSAGENCIVIIPGANAEVNETYVLRALSRIRDYKILICQNEIPFEASCAALRHASSIGVRTIFNPAPVPSKDTITFLRRLRECQVCIVCPNEIELATLTGGMQTNSKDDVRDAARKLLSDSGCRVVVVTLGAKGAYVLSDEDCDEFTKFHDTETTNTRVAGIDRFISTESVTDVVDTTGAGDSFIGSLAAHLCRGATIVDAVYCALRIASMSVLEQGAQVSFKHHADLPSDICPATL